MTRAILALPVLVTILVGWLVPYAKWNSITDGLLVFLGLLVAALVQVIPVTANFLQADSLTVDEAKQLSAALERQQEYWLGLLGAAVVTAIFLIVGKVIPEHFGLTRFSIGTVPVECDIPMILSGLIGGLLTLLVLKTFGIFPGVLSLQKLRSELVIKAAKRRLANQVQSAAASRGPVPQIVPDDYGKIINPPH